MWQATIKILLGEHPWNTGHHTQWSLWRHCAGHYTAMLLETISNANMLKCRSSIQFPLILYKVCCATCSLLYTKENLNLDIKYLCCLKIFWRLCSINTKYQGITCSISIDDSSLTMLSKANLALININEPLWQIIQYWFENILHSMKLVWRAYFMSTPRRIAV